MKKNKLLCSVRLFIASLVIQAMLASSCSIIDINGIKIKAGISVDEPITTVTVDEGTTLLEKLAWIQQNVKRNTEYVIELTDDESIPSVSDSIDPPNKLSFSQNNVIVRLIGKDTLRIISCASDPSILFEIGFNTTLILDENIHLKPSYSGTAVVLNHGGNLIMNSLSKINSDAGWASSIPGSNGVQINDGSFIMNDGEMSTLNIGVIIQNGVFIMNKGNILSINLGVSMTGGAFTMKNGQIKSAIKGVFVGDYDGKYATFTMEGGKITPFNSSIGVYVSGGKFSLNEGEIDGISFGGGSGVFVEYNGNFTMNSGKIFGNIPNSGVSINEGTFTMNGGEIYGNNPHGVTLSSSGDSSAFTMHNGKIYNNGFNGVIFGGGVEVSDNGVFIMDGGEIYNNYAYKGGGVYIHPNGSIDKKAGGGTIYGSTGSKYNNAIAGSGSGYTAYVDNSPALSRDTIVGPSDQLFYNNSPSSTPVGWDVSP